MTQKKHATPLKRKESSKRIKKSHRLIIFVIAGVFTAVAAGTIGWYVWFSNQYALTIYPGVSVLDMDVSGMTVQEAKDVLTSRVNEMQENGIVLHFSPEKSTTDDVQLQLPPTLVSFDAASVERTLYTYDIDATISAAYAVGRQGGRMQRFTDRLQSARTGVSVPLTHTFQHDRVRALIDETFASYETSAKNADILVDADGTISTVAEIPGTAFDTDVVLAEIENAIAAVTPTTIELALVEEAPVLTQSDIEENREMIEEYLAAGPIVLSYNDQEWTFESDVIATWLSFQSDVLAVHPERLEESLTEDVIAAINQKPQEGRFAPVIDDSDTITAIETIVEPQQGQKVNVEKTAEKITSLLQSSPVSDSLNVVEIDVDVVEPKYTQERVNELGIVDVLGRGQSNMAGSPPNRVVNITRGAELLDGILIAPDEVFSLNNALRPYTAENGYLAELVIVGDKTIPEYGGGLCQIGTTAFRTTMNSGLDVIERAAHSYAVSYYFEENGLPGTDATIYDQVVDYTFKNDTGNYILLNTDIAVDGTITFTMSGKSDGREGSYSQPTISGWVAPPPPKEIPTTDLAPGQRDCSESAHDGTSAQFDYTVKYADGTSHEETFTSYYKPWQAVCRVGIEKEKPKEEESEEKEESKEKQESPKEKSNE